MAKSRKPVYLHVGFNKAATTMLQEQVFSRHPQFAYLGRPYSGHGLLTSDGANGDVIVEELIRAIRMKDSLSYDAQWARQQIDRVLHALRDSDKSIVLSDGGLTNARFNDRRMMAERLRNLFGACHIVATIRSQLTCIPSLYFFLVRQDMVEDEGFDKWLDRQIKARPGQDDEWTVRQFKYAQIFELYREIFPEAEITFIPYELLVTDKAAFASALARSFGVDVQVTMDTVATSQARNVVGSAEAAHAIRNYEKVASLYSKVRKAWLPRFKLSESMPAVWRAKEALRNSLIQRVEKRHRGAFSLSDSARATLVDYFSDSNARLCRLMDCDLSQLGYPVSTQKDWVAGI